MISTSCAGINLAKVSIFATIAHLTKHKSLCNFITFLTQWLPKLLRQTHFKVLGWENVFIAKCYGDFPPFHDATSHAMSVLMFVGHEVFMNQPCMFVVYGLIVSQELLTWPQYQGTVLPLLGLPIFFLTLWQKGLTRISYLFILPGCTMFEEGAGVYCEQTSINCKYLCGQIVCLYAKCVYVHAPILVVTPINYLEKLYKGWFVRCWRTAPQSSQ